MNNFKLTYGEVLQLLVDNLDSAQFFSHLDDDAKRAEYYGICYHYENCIIEFFLEDFTYYSTCDEDPYSLFRTCFITRNGKHRYSNLSIPYGYTDIPKTKEEWFNFSIMYQETEVDFENYLKLVEYLNNEKNKLQ